MTGTGVGEGWRLAAPQPGSLGELPPTPGRAAPHSPGAEQSRAASSARLRLFMAAGSMWPVGLAKARALRAGVLWGAGLAGRSLGQQTEPPGRPEGPSPFLASECNLLPGIHR